MGLRASENAGTNVAELIWWQQSNDIATQRYNIIKNPKKRLFQLPNDLFRNGTQLDYHGVLGLIAPKIMNSFGWYWLVNG